jgi:hypothetical protein
MIAYMTERKQQKRCAAPLNGLESANAGQREMLTKLLTAPMYETARRLAPLIDLRSVLEMLLIDEIEQLGPCKFLYVLDAKGWQITASIGHDSIDQGHYARNRADHSYMQNIIGFSDFRLSETYLGEDSRQPSITAIQVIRDRNMQRAGYLGADFDVHELSRSRTASTDTSQGRNHWKNLAFIFPAI